MANQVLPSVENYITNLFNQAQRLGSAGYDLYSQANNKDNLSGKSASDYSQITERNDFAAFLMDSSHFYKSNRFYCAVFPPTGLKHVMEYYNKDKSGFRFSIEAASLPEQNIETFDYKLGNNNPIIKMPYNKSYGDGTITLTFRMRGSDKLSTAYLERKIFLTWQESIFSFSREGSGEGGKGGPGAEYYDKYCSNSAIILSQIDTASNRVYNTIFKNVYPVSVAGIEYSWNPSDDYVRQNVTFAFSKMFSEGVKPEEK